MIDPKERIMIIAQITISSFVIIGFFARLILSQFFPMPVNMQRTADTFDGALIGGFVAVLGFWIGSSKSSEKKDQTIADSAREAATTAANAVTIAAATRELK